MNFLKISILFFALLPATLHAQTSVKDTLVLKHGAHRTGKRTDAAMNKWRDNRFGQFIHWGLYSKLGGYWQGKYYPGAAEWIREWAHIPAAAYDSLIYQFDPLHYNPVAWAAMAKQMGVKYVTITTKHHEGFCLWPSKYTDFSIAATPYRKDLLRSFVDAYTKAGIDVYFYYSVLDWHNPDWRYDIRTSEDSLAFDRYKEYVKNQLTELLERYPAIKGFWFDGTWDNSWKKNGRFTDELEQYLKKIHPGLIVNSRLRADDLGSRHFDSNGRLMGDYASGWERKLPPLTDTAVLHYDWEAVMTIPENQWGYSAHWEGHIKTPGELIEMLAHSVSMGGNFMLNFGPKPDGTFRIEEQKIAAAIGNWMKVNGEAIYGCDVAGLVKEDWGYYTRKTGTDSVYMIVCNTPVSGALRVQLPKGFRIAGDRLLASPGKDLPVEEIEQHEYFIHLGRQDFHQPYVIRLLLQPEAGSAKSGYRPAKT